MRISPFLSSVLSISSGLLVYKNAISQKELKSLQKEPSIIEVDPILYDYS